MAEKDSQASEKLTNTWIPNLVLKVLFGLAKLKIISMERGATLADKWMPILIKKFVHTK